MKRKWKVVLTLLILLLAACSGGQADNKGTWDGSNWDSVNWQ